jgi:hypothetical protein
MSSSKGLQCQMVLSAPIGGIGVSAALSTWGPSRQAKRPGKTRICQACRRAFVSTHGRWYCSDVCRGEVKILTCMTCRQSFRSRHSGRWYCSEECRTTSKAPAVYRFICPDGRSYVGSVRDCRKRANNGIQRSNSQLLAAFELHPPETWTFEVLERLPHGCSTQTLREARQHHIDRLAVRVGYPNHQNAARIEPLSPEPARTKMPQGNRLKRIRHRLLGESTRPPVLGSSFPPTEGQPP